MAEFLVINSDDAGWQKLISGCNRFDFYHTSCYHRLEKEGIPLLLVAKNEAGYIALPVLLRSIGNSEYKDITSSYGFSGPVSSMEFRDVPEELYSFMRESLKSYFDSQKVITAFSRLHPMICGDRLFDGFGNVKTVKQMVGIDLRSPMEEQVLQYRKSTRKGIANLRHENRYTVREGNRDEDVCTFTEMYHENMRRVSAGENYFFDIEYFRNLLSNTCYQTKLLFAMQGSHVAAGAIFTITNTYMQYHLAATRQEYIAESPMKLLVDEARVIANNLHLEYFHLGGSVGDSNDDPLFRFKSGFSKERFSFRVWQYVHDENAYAQINTDYGRHHSTSNYFPLYRS